MERFFKIILHCMVFAVGLPAIAFTNFWDWELFRGLVLPAIATGFLIYLILFTVFGGYRVFRSNSQ